MEIDLMANYPKAKRNLDKRSSEKSDYDREIARKFEVDFFDGDRKHGYGGFSYNEKYWTPVVPDFIRHWNMKSGQSLLDIGCAKGFMLYDFKRLLPGLIVKGIDISNYAIANSHPDVKEELIVANAKSLPFEDNSFDYVISINTVHNLDREECLFAIQEIERVSRLGSFITVDAYRNEIEKQRMYDWNLTARTIMSVEEWKTLFAEIGYTGDYFWFIP
jgi:ubiquinone/menaquinone biosynthesis C-methylase UbiE